eukprot:1159784-Pelagomonas_calceolata.AAC.10
MDWRPGLHSLGSSLPTVAPIAGQHHPAESGPAARRDPAEPGAAERRHLAESDAAVRQHPAEPHPAVWGQEDVCWAMPPGLHVLARAGLPTLAGCTGCADLAAAAAAAAAPAAADLLQHSLPHASLTAAAAGGHASSHRARSTCALAGMQGAAMPGSQTLGLAESDRVCAQWSLCPVPAYTGRH